MGGRLKTIDIITERQLDKNKKVIDFIKKSSLESCNSNDFDESMYSVVDETCLLLNADHAHLYFRNPDTGNCDLYYSFTTEAHSFEETLKSFPAGFMETMVRPIINEGVISYSKQEDFPSAIGDVLKSVGVKSFIISPILIENVNNGVLIFEALDGEIEWDYIDVSLVSSVEGLISSLYF